MNEAPPTSIEHWLVTTIGAANEALGDLADHTGAITLGPSSSLEELLTNVALIGIAEAEVGQCRIALDSLAQSLARLTDAVHAHYRSEIS